ncbi:MAG: type II toxin-antitoxin system VapC family toxin [Chloroflexi bacterium]|nr:type II toxin-antitoxin system VapC family toxin [Chloroflexota bacterium]
MSNYFFDTSAVVKCYIVEPGTTWVRQLCNAQAPDTGEKLHLIFISEIAIVESAAAFAILARRGEISKRDSQDAYAKFVEAVEREYRIVDLTRPSVRAAAGLTQRHPLKSLDAIQLAIGLNTRDLLQANELSLVFVTGDDQLLQAAQAEGLATENPFDHADLDTAEK